MKTRLSPIVKDLEPYIYEFSAFLQTVGLDVFEQLNLINEAIQNSIPTIEMLDKAFGLLVHLCPVEWELCPNPNTPDKAVMAYTVLKQPTILGPK